jgi:hypothetical protein
MYDNEKIIFFEKKSKSDYKVIVYPQRKLKVGSLARQRLLWTGLND